MFRNEHESYHCFIRRELIEVLSHMLDVPKFDQSWINFENGVLKYVYDLSVKSMFADAR